LNQTFGTDFTPPHFDERALETTINAERLKHMVAITYKKKTKRKRKRKRKREREKKEREREIHNNNKHK